MKARRNLAVAALLGAVSAAASAQDPEVTMRLIPSSAADSRAVLTELIRLPDPSAERAVERSADGLETANANRADAAARRTAALERASANRAAGLATAAEVRERGAEIAEAANGNREDVTRGRPDRSEPPSGPPERPAQLGPR